jgi:hypothetical protein
LFFYQKPTYLLFFVLGELEADLPAVFHALGDPGELVVCYFLVERSTWLVVKSIIACVSTQQHGVNHQDLDHAPSRDVVGQGVVVVRESPGNQSNFYDQLQESCSSEEYIVYTYTQKN